MLTRVNVLADPNLRTELFGPDSFQERVPSECGKPLLRRALSDEDNVRQLCHLSQNCFL